MWIQGRACDSSSPGRLSFRIFAGIIRKEDVLSSSIAKLVGKASTSATFIISSESEANKEKSRDKRSLKAAYELLDPTRPESPPLDMSR